MNRRDALIAAALFLLFSVGGWCFLTGFGIQPGQKFGDDRPTFTPAIGVAAGMGYSHIYLDAPGVAEFMSGESSSLDLTPLKEPALFAPAIGKFDLDRVYLLTAIGWLWRFFGVQWQVVWLLPSLFLGLCAVATYGIFRLAAPYYLAVAGVLLTLVSPAYLDILPGVRDFCKAPFVLFTMLFCGLLIRGDLAGRKLLLVSAMIGVLIGVGMGFRQDTIICLPPVLGCLLFAATAPLPRRALAASIAVTAFLLPAWPVLRMNAETGGNNSFYLIQGFSQSSYADLHLRPASYTPLFTHIDQVVHAYICAFSEAERYDFPTQHRVHHAASIVRGMSLAAAMPGSPRTVLPAIAPMHQFVMWGTGAESIARRQAELLYTTLPADVLTRAYGSVLALLCGAVRENIRDDAYRPMLGPLKRLRAPLHFPLLYLGFPLALLGFALMAARSPWRAFLSLAVFLYFLGYPSLSFQPRHVFHLTLACWWFPIFLLVQARGLPRLVRELGLAGLLRALPMPAARAGAFLVLISICMAGPLYAARWWQAGNMAVHVEKLRAADLEAVTTTAHPELGGNVLYRPVQGTLFSDLEGSWLENLLSLRPDPGIAAEYLAADIELAGASTPHLMTRHENEEACLNGMQALGPSLPSVATLIRVYFPVFGFSQSKLESEPMALSPFEGIALTQGASLKQLYRVRNRTDFPLQMIIQLPQSPAQFKSSYKLRLWPCPPD
jgi:hypothetical protein